MRRKSSAARKGRPGALPKATRRSARSAIYKQVLEKSLQLAEHSAASEIFLTRTVRTLNELAEVLSDRDLAQVSSAKTDARVLFRLLNRPELAADIAPVSPDLSNESLRDAAPEVISTVSMLRGAEAKRELLEAAGGTLSSEQVAELLGISRQAVHKKTMDRELFALSVGRRGYIYPGVQFTRDGSIVKGLNKVLKVLDQDDWGALIFLLEPDRSLGDQSPIKALHTGRLNEVIALARAYGDQGGH